MKGGFLVATGVSVLVFLAALIILAWAGAQLPGITRSKGEPRELKVVLEKFKFSPEVIEVNQGDVVKIKLEARDVVHGFYIDGYGVNQEVEPNRGAEVEFVADKAGVYRFRCSTTCGAFHPFMVGKLVVNGSRNYFPLVAVGVALAVSIGAVGAPWYLERRRGHGGS